MRFSCTILVAVYLLVAGEVITSYGLAVYQDNSSLNPRRFVFGKLIGSTRTTTRAGTLQMTTTTTGGTRTSKVVTARPSTTYSTSSRSRSTASSLSSSAPSSASSCSTTSGSKSGKNSRSVEEITLKIDGKEITVSAERTDQGQTANTWRTAKFPKAGSTTKVPSIIKCFKEGWDTQEAFDFEKTALKTVGQFVNFGTNSCGRRCLVIEDLTSRNLVPAENIVKSMKFANREECLAKVAFMAKLVIATMKIMVEKTKYLHLDNHPGNCFFNADGTEMEFIDWGRNAQGKGVRLLKSNVFPEKDAAVQESYQLVDFFFKDENDGLAEDCPA